MNEKFKGIADEALSATRDEKFAELQRLIGLESPSPDEVTTALALGAEVDEYDAEIALRTKTAADNAAAFEALKSRKFGAEAVEASEGEGEPVEEEPEEPAEEEPEGSTEPQQEAAAKPVAAKAKTAAELAAKTSKPKVPAKPEELVTITAANDVPAYSAGSAIPDLDALGEAVVSRMRGFTPPSGDGKSENLQKFGVATIRLPFEKDLIVDRGTDDMAVIERAADESRLDGDSLVAAGGWCAPSETLYDLVGDESLEGILSLPEMQVNRGGIRYTMGPQFADFYAEAGFVQTEAQAIAGTTKPCYEVDCPAFVDVRLDAVGVCIKVPILTNAAYPELVRRFTEGTMVAHAHMVNANVIGRIVTSAGAARVFTGLGSTAGDTLGALELVANQRRQAYRLPMSRSLEVVVPFWVLGAVRADLAFRTGQEAPVTDQQIRAHFAARNLNVQFVYDWQVIDETAEVYPATFQALVYPAGTFVKGVSDVINLSAVYDAASLAVNTYTGLFMEQGLLVARRQYAADLVTLPICNAGRTGAANLTCA